MLAEGASNWPYQVHEVNLVSLSDGALLPDGLAADLHEGAELAKTYCLQCHKVNGFGGEKFPGNLAVLARVRAEPDFIRWVLNPSGGAQQHHHAASLRPAAGRRAPAHREGVVRLPHGGAGPAITGGRRK